MNQVNLAKTTLEIDTLIDQVAAGEITPDDCKESVLEKIVSYDLGLRQQFHDRQVLIDAFENMEVKEK